MNFDIVRFAIASFAIFTVYVDDAVK